MTNESFERVYTNDNFSEVFAAFRDQYSARGQEALAGRKIDKQPQPNATTIIYLKDDPSGDVRVSGTGDFVEFYNRRNGNDSIGATRLAFEVALRKQEERLTAEGRSPEANREPAVEQGPTLVRAFRPRISFMQAIFAMMLLLSLVLLSVTSMLLEKADAAVFKAKAELAELTALSEQDTEAPEQIEQNALSETSEAVCLALDGEDSVEIHPVEEQEFSFATLLDALATLGK